jgi:DNA-binding transcriptional LysR family regulator
VAQRGVSVALACRTFGVSETCFRYSPKRNADNDEIADLLLGLVSASEAYAAYVLPDIVARVRAEAPKLTLILVSSNKFSDLQTREADIAVRHVRPEESELIGKMVGTSSAHFHASVEWISRNGVPGALEDITSHLVGLDDLERFSAHMRDLGVPLTSCDVKLASSSSLLGWELVRRGMGVGIMLKAVAERTPGVARLFADQPVSKLPLWLVTHRELKTSRRIRLVFDILDDELSRLA